MKVNLAFHHLEFFFRYICVCIVDGTYFIYFGSSFLLFDLLHVKWQPFMCNLNPWNPFTIHCKEDTHLVPLGVNQNIRLINKKNLINNILWSWNSLDDCIKKQWLLHPCVWPRKGGTPKASKSFSNHVFKKMVCLFWIEVFIKIWT
jgi:hypothetical protein